MRQTTFSSHLIARSYWESFVIKFFSFLRQVLCHGFRLIQLSVLLSLLKKRESLIIIGPSHVSQISTSALQKFTVATLSARRARTTTAHTAAFVAKASNPRLAREGHAPTSMSVHRSRTPATPTGIHAAETHTVHISVLASQAMTKRTGMCARTQTSALQDDIPVRVVPSV